MLLSKTKETRSLLGKLIHLNLEIRFKIHEKLTFPNLSTKIADTCIATISKN